MAPFDDKFSTHIQTDDAPTSGSTNIVTSGTLHTALAAKESILTFANSPLTSVGGSIARGEGTNAILYTPPTLTSYAPKASPTFTGGINTNTLSASGVVKGSQFEVDYSSIPSFSSDQIGYTMEANVVHLTTLVTGWNQDFFSILNVPRGVWLLQCQCIVYPPFPAAKDVRMYLREGSQSAGNSVTLRQFEFKLTTPTRSEAQITFVHRHDDLKDIGAFAYLHPTQLGAGFTTKVYSGYTFLIATRIA